MIWFKIQLVVAEGQMLVLSVQRLQRRATILSGAQTEALFNLFPLMTVNSVGLCPLTPLTPLIA